MQQDRQSLTMALAAGGASAMLYLLSVGGGFFSLLIAYTPLLPLLLTGLALGPRAVTLAALLATFVAGATSGVAGLMLYGLLYAAPSIFFTHVTLTLTLSDKKHWYPIGGVLTGLSLYAATVIGTLIALLMHDVTSLAEFLPEAKEGTPVWIEQARGLVVKAPFLVFAMGAWVQILMFYAIAVFANFMLAGWDRQIRRSLRLVPFMPSIFVLAAMLMAGLLSFSESIAMQTAGKTAFIILLLPYFLMGIAQMHARARRWPNRNFWLFTIYMLTVLVFWPIFWFIGAGLFEQARFLSNRYGSGTDT